MIDRLLRTLLTITIALSPLTLLAKDEEPAATAQTPFMVAYMFVGLFIVLGIMAIMRSTVRGPGGE